jgi:hypothetical protein
MANTLSRALVSPAFFHAKVIGARDREPGFARARDPLTAPLLPVDRTNAAKHHRRMITNSCMAALSKKVSLPGASDRRAR